MSPPSRPCSPEHHAESHGLGSGTHRIRLFDRIGVGALSFRISLIVRDERNGSCSPFCFIWPPTVLTAFSWNLWSFMFFRFLTGAGIGGEYAAINSAIDELIPARTRGHTDLAINGSWWLGSAAGAVLAIVLLNPLLIPEYLGWRLCFGFGAVLGVSILLVRRVIPESPRWLMTHGKVREADEVVAGIEAQILPDARGHARCRRLKARSTVMRAACDARHCRAGVVPPIPSHDIGIV